MSESTTDGETVWIAGTGRRNGQLYHTDKNCTYGPADPKPRPLNALTGFRECKFCAGEQPSESNGDDVFRAALELELDAEEKL